jgi:DNA-binding CsgD family transcriptional regulator
MPTDDVLEQVEEFHANLTAALNWSADLPPVGLRLLQGVGRAWEHLGRAGDAMVAADHLLTDDNAARYTAQCVTAAYSSADLYFSARGPNDYGKHLQWIETVAGQLGDEYHVGLARWREETFDTRAVLRDIARERGDRYVEAWATINLASEFAQNDPVAAAPLLLQADAVAAASGMHSLRDAARFAHAEAAAAQGDLDDTIDIAKDMLESPSSMIWSKAVRALSAAGLLAQNDAALGRAVEAADRALRKSPGLAPWAYTARRRRALLDGQPAMIDPNVRDPNWTWPSSPWTLWLICRETIDAGAPDAAVEHIRLWARPTICGQAVLAAVEAAASGNEDRWQDALAIAVDHRLRLIAVDALEGVAVTAGRAESWTECLRLLAAARRLRDETGYQWRFAFEKGAVDTTRAASLAALADDAHKATIEGGNLDWIDAVSYARRARGQRKRPHHGWTSLTPTEQKVVALVAQGLSNPQIAARLLMGRATVKTHIEHIFTKLGVQSRAALAAEAARRTPQ